MPLTWFAHQVPVLGMKLGRPRWFDATALCMGSMAPDLLYAVSGYLDFDTHRAPESFVWGLPTAILLATLVRFVIAPVSAAQLPDLGRFRLRSYAVLARRHPAPTATVFSAFLGLGSHIVLDWFTHPGRPGVRWLRYDNVRVTAFGVTEPLAGVFQLIGHTFGSLVGVWLLWVIGTRRLLDDWYGTDLVADARRWVPDTAQRLVFWSCVALGLVAGAAWAWPGDLVERFHRTFLGVTAGAALGALAMRRDQAGAARSVTSVAGDGAAHSVVSRATR